MDAIQKTKERGKNMEEFVRRRSKIYTYFYGRNTLLQKFIILVGVLLLLLANVAGEANYESYQKKSTKLRTAMQQAETEYRNVYNEAEFNRYWMQQVEPVKGEDYYTEMVEYNDLLENYKKAQEKYNDFREKDSDENFMSGLCLTLGVITVLGGIGWIIYKKLSFNSVGESEYDEELAIRVEEAKKKGLEKLNIVAEQIESVEPVVLNGVASTDNVVVKVDNGLFRKVFSKIWQFILKFDVILLGLIAVFVTQSVALFICSNMAIFVIFFLLVIGGLGYLGYWLYKKYEVDSFVSERTINRLDKFMPKQISKLGTDDAVRMTLPAITVYMFGEEQLYMYYQYLDIVTGKVFQEGINEYFYEDVVGITSEQTVMKTFKRYGFLKLRLKYMDFLQESIAVVTSGCIHEEDYIVPVGKSLLDTQFTSMRNLIRLKKDAE